MKSASVASSVLHAALLTWGLWSFGQPKPLDLGAEAMPVSLVPIEEFSEAMQGDEEAPVAEKSAPKPVESPHKLPMPAENVGANQTDQPTPPAPKPSPRESVQTAAAAPPPPPPPTPTPTEAPKPPEPTPAPQVAEKVPEPTPAPPEETAEAEAKPDPTPAEEQAPIDELSELIAKAPPVPEPPRNVPRPQVKPKPPEPVKVAEAKPAPPAKPAETAPQKTPEKTKPSKKPGTEATNDDFDALVTAALVNKQESTGGGAKSSTQQAAYGKQQATGAKLSRSETDALLSQLRGCWAIPGGILDPQALRVSVRFSLDDVGKLTGAPQVEASSGNRTFDESAVRAIRRCDQQGLAVPPGKQSEWAEIVIDFNPSEMF